MARRDAYGVYFIFKSMEQGPTYLHSADQAMPEGWDALPESAPPNAAIRRRGALAVPQPIGSA